MSGAREDCDGRAQSYDAAAVDIEIVPPCFRPSQTTFSLQAVVERRAAVPKRIAVLMRWHWMLTG